MARKDLVDVSFDDYVVVPVGVEEHDEVRALDEEIGFLAALWGIESGLVHLLAHLCSGGQSRWTNVEVQVAVGYYQLCRLPRLRCHDGIAVAE